MSKFTKNNKVKLIEEDIDIKIEELDKEINEFYINKEKIEGIKIPSDKDMLIKNAIDKAEIDMNKERTRKNIVKAATIAGIILSVGVYNPVLAHKVPPIQTLLEKVNDVLNIDEIASLTKIDKIIPKASLDENDKIIFVKTTNYKVYEKIESVDKEIKEEDNKDKETKDEKQEKPNIAEELNYRDITNDYEAVLYIHEMSNTIVKANRKYGAIEITPENIDKAINGLKYINNEYAKEYLNGALNRWKSGEFDNAVVVHNYVWDMLDGQIGKAFSVDYEKVNKVKSKYFN